MVRTTGHLALLLAVILAADFGDAQEPAESAQAFSTSVRPFLVKHCQSCHGGDEPEAMLSVDALDAPDSITKHRKTWVRVLAMAGARKMPPQDEPRPEEAHLKAFTEWIETALVQSLKGVRDPGRVTIRRLNRAEYANTVRDLLGVEFDPSGDFPEDDTGYGFDTIGDVLSISPLHMEKYLAAAKQLSEEAIHAPNRWRGRRYGARDLSGGTHQGDHRLLTSSGHISVRHQVDKPGKHLVRARAFGDQAGDEPVRMMFRVGGRDIQTVDVPAEGDAPGEYSVEVELPKGRHQIGVAFVNDYYRPDHPDPTERDRNLFVERIELIPVEDAQRDLPAAHRRILSQPVAADRPLDSAREMLRAFATRAYRRPARDAEVARLVKLVELVQQDGGGFEQGMQLAVRAVLASPSFLFHGEFDAQPDDPAKVHPVDEYELASRLSYFLWSSMPDDELFRLAEKNELRKNLDGQVRRMLADPKSRALAENFGGQWLETRRLAMMAPDPQRFPEFDEALRDAMRTETEMFFTAVVHEDRPATDFLDGQFTFVNERLARHYGIDGVRGEAFQRVELDGRQRSGVLTQASVLMVTSNPTRTSPVLRGKWILEQVLGETLPPPDPNAGALDDSAELTGTLRQRTEQHRANPTCMSCHQKMDPLGFALENYSAIGRWRTKEGKFDIDASAELPDGRKFTGPQELKKLLVERRADFRRALAEKMLTYALGRGLEYYDEPALDKIASHVEKANDKFSSLVLGIVHSDPFQLRRGDGGVP